MSLKPIAIPRTLNLMRDAHIKLYLKDCKLICTLAGKFCLVSLTYGDGYYGTVKGDTLYPTSQCKQEYLDQVLKVETEGTSAIREIGLLTGSCCICGRTLTNEESINGGIGPICAGKLPFEAPDLF